MWGGFAGLLQGKDFGQSCASVLFGQNLFLVISQVFAVVQGVPGGLGGCPSGCSAGSCWFAGALGAVFGLALPALAGHRIAFNISHKGYDAICGLLELVFIG